LESRLSPKMEDVRIKSKKENLKNNEENEIDWKKREFWMKSISFIFDLSIHYTFEIDS